MNIILVFLIAISLSMDAFSLSLAYGTLSMKKKQIMTLALIVGLYHFFMPIFGNVLGEFITNKINIGGNVIVLIIFVCIGVNMIIESFSSKEKVHELKFLEMLLFGLAVSIDSFSVGIGIKNISNNMLISSLIFSVTSFIFTYIGLILGNKINKLIGSIATLIGGIILILFGILYMVNGI